MELSEFYDCYWAARDDNVDHRRLDLIVELVRQGERVLQVDCGPGMLAQRLQAKGALVTATDLSLVAVERAKQKGIDVHQVSLDDGPLPFLDGAFDVVVSDSSIEHLFFYREALAECTRVLRPGGRFILLLPNIGHWRFRLWLLAGRFPYIKDSPTDVTHLRFFTFCEAKRLCEKLGLKVRRSDGSASLWTRGLYPPLLRRSIARRLYTRAAHIWPSLFARDFVLLCEKPLPTSKRPVKARRSPLRCRLYWVLRVLFRNDTRGLRAQARLYKEILRSWSRKLRRRDLRSKKDEELLVAADRKTMNG